MRPAPILVAIDFSQESDQATRHAMAVARRQGAELVLLHAATVLDPVEHGDQLAVPAYRQAVDDDLKRNRALLEELRARLAGQGVDVSHAVVDGFPDTTITKVAEEIGAGTIVLGTHGRTGLRWFLLGSVAQRVVRLAATNVLVARGDAPAGGYRKICVATDFSPSADRALQAAIAMAAPDATIDVIHCWYLSPSTGLAGESSLVGGLLIAERDSIDARLRARGQQLIDAHRAPGVSMSFEPIFAPTRDTIVQRLERGDHDLVALGSHGRRGLRRFVLGSVAEAVVARAPCAALVSHA